MSRYFCGANSDDSHDALNCGELPAIQAASAKARPGCHTVATTRSGMAIRGVFIAFSLEGTHHDEYQHASSRLLQNKDESNEHKVHSGLAMGEY